MTGGAHAGAGEPGAGNVPVAGAGNAGSSSRTLRAPLARARATAVRRPTDCSTRSLSSREPTAKARGGLPSTAIRARPYAPVPSGVLERGAITPTRRKREALPGAPPRRTATTGGAPNSRARSPRGGAARSIGTA